MRRFSVRTHSFCVYTPLRRSGRGYPPNSRANNPIVAPLMSNASTAAAGTRRGRPPVFGRGSLSLGIELRITLSLFEVLSLVVAVVAVVSVVPVVVLAQSSTLRDHSTCEDMICM